MSQRYIGGLIHNAPGGWSGKFSGANYLSVASAAGNALGSGDFTIQLWFYLTGTTGVGSSGEIGLIGCGNNTSSRYTIRCQGTSTRIMSWWLNTPSNNVTGTTPIALNTWYHVALVRSGSSSNNVKLYLNGRLECQGTSTYNSPADNISIGRGYPNLAGEYTNGYISNLQILVGTALYTNTFTPPTGASLPVTNTALLTCRYPTIVDGSTNAFTITNTGTVTVVTNNPFPTSALPNPALGNAGNGIYTMSQYAALLGAGTWPAYDPYYKNVVLNLHGNPVASGTFITDASTNNFGLTVVGDTRADLSTPFAGNGYYSNKFNGSSDTLNTASNAAFGFGSGAWTFEAWVYPTVAQTDNWIIATNDSGKLRMRVGASGYLSFYTDTGAIGLNSTTVVTVNSWSHVAICYDGTTLSLFQNGTRTATSTVSISNGSANACYIGSNTIGGSYWNGYISNARVVKGTAVYSGATYTVPTTPLTAISGTSLLTCQSNIFIDNSSNSFALTVSGTPSVNALQPFTTPSGISTYGSGYFDGSGDYLEVAYNLALDASTGPFTYEAWLNPNTTTNKQYLGGSVTNAFFAFIGSGTIFVGRNNVAVDFTSSATIKINQWNHVVIVRNSSNNIAIFINGSSAYYAASNTNNYGLASNSLRIGVATTGSSYEYSGYISNVRVAKSALYDPTASTITVPTAPLTAGSAGLLTLQTNNPVNNNTFFDSSPNNYTITRTGSITQGSFTPYITNGYWSNNFNGSSGVTVSSTSSQFGFSGDFTWEAWINPSALPSSGGNYSIICSRGANASASAFQFLFGNSSGTYQITGTISIGSTDYNLTWNIPTAPSVGIWYHVAMVRSGISVNVYWNGTAIGAGQTASGTTNTPSVNPSIGFRGGSYNDLFFNGYISNLRMVGSALYTSGFTPSTAPLTAVSGTRLLTCQSHRLLDNSSNAFTLTSYSTPTTQVFQPFRLPVPYTVSAFGGSGSFYGASNSLATPSGTCPVINDFSASGWVYRTSVPGYQQTFIAMGLDGPGRVGFFWTGSNFEYNIYGSSTVTIDGSGSMPVGVWTYVVLTRTGSTITLYYNGVLKATVTQGTAFSASSGRAMSWMDGTIGYATNLRFDTAAYSSPTTVPTAPVSYTANTNNLLNFTNFGVIDNSMQNDLVTAGNAQINTSTIKYGNGSIYFDGSGDYLTANASPSWLFSGDWTMEAWIYPTSVTGVRVIFETRNRTTSASPCLYTSGTNLVVDTGAAAVVTAGTIVINTWQHVAATRSGNSWRIFINGTQVGATTTNTTTYSTAYGCCIGSSYYNEDFAGYIDDARITQGVARYTANFTPPTSQLQDQ